MSIVSNMQQKKEIMVRVPESVIKFMGGFPKLMYGSRPEVLIAAGRSFLEYLNQMENKILLDLEGKNASDQVKRQYYYEEMENAVSPFKERYSAFVDGSRDVQIMVKCPTGLYNRIEAFVERSGCFRNYHDFTKTAFAFMIVQDLAYHQLETKMNIFLRKESGDIQDELSKLRREIESSEE